MDKGARLKARRKKGTAWNSTLKPGPWTRDGKTSPQTRVMLKRDGLTSLWVRTLNASMFFTLHGEGFYPGGAEGLSWSKCQLEGCNRMGDRCDHLWGRSGAKSKRQDPKAMGVLCGHHNEFAKGSEDWGDYRPERFVVLIERLVPQHFDQNPLYPERLNLNRTGKLWLRRLHGSLA